MFNLDQRSPWDYKPSSEDNESMVKYALSMPELRTAITEQVYECSPESKATLLSLALTSKSFFETCQPIIWVSIRGIAPLVNLFPADILQIDAAGRIAFIRSLADKDWVRFNLYSRFVKSILFNSDTLTKIDESVLIAMRMKRRSQTWLPNLQHINIDKSDEIRHASSLVNRSLRTLSITDLQSRITRTSDWDKHHTDTKMLLEAAVAQGCCLEDIGFQYYDESYLADTLSRTLRRSNLRSFAVNCVIQSADVFRALQRCHNLTYICLALNDHFFKSWTRASDSMTNIFPHLRSLYLTSYSVSTLPEATTCFADSPVDLVEIKLATAHNSTINRTGEITKVLESLNGSTWRLKSVLLTGNSQSDLKVKDRLTTSQCLAAIRQLLSRPGLTYINLHKLPIDIISSLDAGDLHDLVPLLRNAKEIGIVGATNRKFTLRTIAKFCKALPKLEIFHCSGVRLDDVPASNHYPNLALRELYLTHNSVAACKFLDFMMYIKGSFPVLRSFRHAAATKEQAAILERSLGEQRLSLESPQHLSNCFFVRFF